MPTGAKVPVYVALLVAGVSVAINLRYGWFVPIFADTAGYVGSAARWAEGTVHTPDHFQFLPQFPNSDQVGSPLGFRSGGIKGTSVVEYPPGTGLFVAAGMMIHRLGGYVVAALFAGWLALGVYALAAALAGRWAGVLAALLISASPLTIRHTVSVNSDVPAAALWMLAWLMSLRPTTGGAAAAGAAVAGAVLVRPVTVPLAAVIALLVLWGGEAPRVVPRTWHWGRALLFSALALIGPVVVLWSNETHYGSAFDFGYKGAAGFFRWSHVVPNLTLYPASLIRTHSLFAFLGVAAVPMAVWRARRSRDGTRPRLVAVSAIAIVTVNYALYIAYLNYESWTYLRFLLPAIAALFILLAAATVWFAEWLAARSRLLAVVALIPAAVVVWRGIPLAGDALREWKRAESVLIMGHYLREAAPRDAVFLCYVHCGSVAYYSRRPIVRLDVTQPEFDALIARLQRQRYRPILILDEAIETRERLAVFYPRDVYAQLDWTPRAAFKGIGRIWYYDVADRPLHRSGTYYPVDVLPQP